MVFQVTQGIEGEEAGMNALQLAGGLVIGVVVDDTVADRRHSAGSSTSAARRWVMVLASRSGRGRHRYRGIVQCGHDL